MYTFQYKQGDRPLEGYTIQSAAGRGGFGEVYYAVSDSGREVALKAVTGYEQIEVRGISQCMNLKSPHLVSIFDVRYATDGRPFVVMEFVSGPSLRQLIDENPFGLGEQKSAFFLREIGKGLTYLHDCGIVHRDMKPGNIFFENGYVKIGDYGLSKAISSSQHSGQTVTVGTVHYMAPEVGAGKYDRSIDIYAMGALLFEMLTGTPPFLGASPSEVLLKHLSAKPDCTNISEPFRSAILRAMAKDPNDRFKNIQEMVEAVFGAEHVQNSVSVFASEELSMVAGRVAKHIGVAAGSSPSPRVSPTVQTTPPVAPPAPRDNWERAARQLDDIGQRLGNQINARLQPQAAADPSRDFSIPTEDSISRRSRIKLAILVSTIVGITGAVQSQTSIINPIYLFAFIQAVIWAQVAAVSLQRKAIVQQMVAFSPAPIFLRRIILTISSAMFALLFAIVPWMLVFEGSRNAGSAWQQIGQEGTWFAMLLPMFFFRADRILDPARRQRVMIGRVVCFGVLGAVFAGLWRGNPVLAAAPLAGMAMVTQILAPWKPRSTSAASAMPQTNAPAPAGAAPPLPNQPQAFAATPPPLPQPQVVPIFMGTPIPTPVRFMWLGGFALSLAIAMALFVAAASEGGRDRATLGTTGVAFVLLSICALVRSLTRRFFGIWHYLIRPLVLVATLGVILIVFSILATDSRVASEEAAIAAFFITLSFIGFIVTLFIPGKSIPKTAMMVPLAPPPLPIQPGIAPISPFKRGPALLLAALGFIPVAGLHRLYAGKIITGILWLITGGLFYIGTIIDMVMIALGTFTDKQGRPLEIWLNETPTRPVGAAAVRAASSSWSVGGNYQRHSTGLLSALAGLLIFVGMILGLALATDLPSAVAAGVFDPKLAQEIQHELFNDYAGWPSLVMRIGVIATGMVLLTGASAALIARRHGGVLHLFRGILGIALLAGAMKPVHVAIEPIDWDHITPLTQSNQIAAAIDLAMDETRPQVLPLAAVMIISGLVTLAWPASHNSQATSPAQPEGAR
jgi:serine/threonine protein kinase